jgi:hypothetical protein
MAFMEFTIIMLFVIDLILIFGLGH